MRSKHNILSITILVALLAGCSSERIVAPEHIWATDNGIVVADNASGRLTLYDRTLQNTLTSLKLGTPINDLAQGTDGTLWVVSAVANGRLLAIDGKQLSVKAEYPMGHTPSAVAYADGAVWVAQRYNNELWRIDPADGSVTAKIGVGREPSSLCTVAGNGIIFVGNNLPEMASTDYPVACKIDVIDTKSNKVLTRLELPNGSTDLKDITIDPSGRYAYAVHLVARYQIPTNQIERGWMSTNAMSVIDLDSVKIVNTVLLDTPQHGAANPHCVSVSQDGNRIWVTAAGSHELLSIDRNALHNRLDSVAAGHMVTPSSRGCAGVVNDAGFLYGIREFYPTGGKGPRALCISDGVVYSSNYYTGELFIMSNSGDIAYHRVGKSLSSTLIGEGDMYFHDATISFQSWQSCASCHPNDARIDGLNWDLLNDGMGNAKSTKSLLYAHQTPPCMVTGIRKDAPTAVRSGIKYIMFAHTPDRVATAMDAYLQSLEAIPSPYLVDGKLSEGALHGKLIFDEHCGSCHSGPDYTDGKQYRVSWADGPDREVAMDVTTLREVWRTAPYLYDGRSYSMRDMLDIHGPQSRLSDTQMDNLTTYVLSL